MFGLYNIKTNFIHFFVDYQKISATIGEHDKHKKYRQHEAACMVASVLIIAILSYISEYGLEQCLLRIISRFTIVAIIAVSVYNFCK